MTRSTVPASHIFLIPLGFIIWSAAFVTLYAVNAIGCEFAWGEGIQRMVLIAIAVGFLAVSIVSIGLVYRYWRHTAVHNQRPAPSLSILGLYGCCSALIATLAISMPVLATSLCV